MKNITLKQILDGKEALACTDAGCHSLLEELGLLFFIEQLNESERNTAKLNTLYLDPENKDNCFTAAVNYLSYTPDASEGKQIEFIAWVQDYEFKGRFPANDKDACLSTLKELLVFHVKRWNASEDYDLLKTISYPDVEGINKEVAKMAIWRSCGTFYEETSPKFIDTGALQFNFPDDFPHADIAGKSCVVTSDCACIYSDDFETGEAEPEECLVPGLANPSETDVIQFFLWEFDSEDGYDYTLEFKNGLKLSISDNPRLAVEIQSYGL